MKGVGAGISSKIAKFDTTLTMWPKASGAVLGILNCNAAIFDRASAQRMVHQFKELIRSIVRTPTADVIVDD